MSDLITVLIHNEDGTKKSVDLAPGSYVCGRDSVCDIEVNALCVSRRHAQLQLSRRSVVVDDLGSTGGTFVDATKITAPTELALPAVVFLNYVTIEIFPAVTAAEEESDASVSASLNAAIPAPPPIIGLEDQARKRLEMLYDLPLKLAAEQDLGRLFSLILVQVLELIPGGASRRLAHQGTDIRKTRIASLHPRRCAANQPDADSTSDFRAKEFHLGGRRFGSGGYVTKHGGHPDPHRHVRPPCVGERKHRCPLRGQPGKTPGIFPG